MGGAARVVADGLGGRTTIYDDFSAAADRNGSRILPTVLGSHEPLDLVILMLGANDMMFGSAFASAKGIRRLVEIVRSFPYRDGAQVPLVLIVAPPRFIQPTLIDRGPEFERAVKESRKLCDHYRSATKDLRCWFFDAATVATPDTIDGVHLDSKNTRAIGEGLVPIVTDALALRPSTQKPRECS